MEEKLAKYRAQKEREAFINKGKEKLKTMFSLPIVKSKQSSDDEILIKDGGKEQEPLIEEDIPSDKYNIQQEIDLEDDNSCCSPLDIVFYALAVVLWGMLYAIFIKLQFGTVYVIVSALIGICLNTRTKPRGSNEISAYSVFNKNCESIDGTLKAEQFEREIGVGRGVFHV